MNRRSFLTCTAVLAPAVILTPGLLMKVKPLQSGFGRLINTDFIELVEKTMLFSTSISRRLDLPGEPWQLYSFYEGGFQPKGLGFNIDFAQLSPFYSHPTSTEIAQHKQIAALAFNRYIKRHA